MRQPSIELLRAVTGLNIKKIGEGNKENIAHWGEDNRYYTTINRYALMHKMKVWAAKQNFKVEHELSYGIERGRARLEQYQEYDMYDVFGYKIGRTSKSDWFDDNSEHEAVTKACEWIVKYLLGVDDE